MAELFSIFKRKFEAEPYVEKLGMRLVEMEPGRAAVEMDMTRENENIFGGVHGGAIYSLIDGAFEAAANSHGTVAVALNVNVSYVAPAVSGETLRAEARELSRSARISTCFIEVRKADGTLIATCQATAYRKKDPLPFLNE
jgi:acyl-CoA thioesterase